MSAAVTPATLVTELHCFTIAFATIVLLLTRAARVQSVATAVRYSASLLALLLGLPLYSCGQHGTLGCVSWTSFTLLGA